MKYAKNTNGIIEFRTLPREYQGKQNYQNASEETHKADGFYPLIEPEYNSSTEKLGAIKKVPDKKEYTYEIVPLTQEELQQKQKQQFKQFKQKLQNDGQAYYDEIDLKITMQFFGRPQAEINQLIAEVDAKIMPIMDLIKSGQWYSAMMLILSTELPTNQEVLTGFNEVKNHTTNYVQTNY